MTPLRFTVLGGLAVLAAAYLGIVLLLRANQTRMIYFPMRGSEGELADVARHAGLEPWVAHSQGEPVLGYRTPAREQPAANRLVVFHGNAGYALHREYFARGFDALEGGRLWQVHLFEYPGYGARPGTPGENAFVQTAEEALAELRREDARPVFLLGESIGSGVACAVAARHPDDVAGLLLITPFTSLTEVGAHHYWFLPVRHILRDRYDNVAALKSYRGPVAFLVAGRDEIVPARFARELHDGFGGPKRLWTQPQAGHNGLEYTPSATFWSEVSDFLLRGGLPRR